MMATVSTSVSIIICTAGKPDSLAKTLQSLQSQVVPPGISTQLIVVDNQPISSREVVSGTKYIGADIIYVEEPKRGLSYARNAGIKRADGDIIIFTDDDLTFPPDWIETIVRPIVSAKADAVAGAIRIAPDLERAWMTPFQRSCYAEILDTDNGKFELVGANMAFHRRVLDAVPEFDVRLGAGALGFCDDTLFSLQLRAAGFQLAFVKDSAVVHHFNPSRLERSAILKHAEQLGRSYGYMQYHWEHKDISAPFLRRLRKFVQLSKRRKQQVGVPGNIEGCSEDEIFEIRGWAIIDQYIIESKSPPIYARPDLKVTKRNPFIGAVSDFVRRVES